MVFHLFLKGRQFRLFAPWTFKSLQLGRGTKLFLVTCSLIWYVWFYLLEARRWEITFNHYKSKSLTSNHGQFFMVLTTYLPLEVLTHYIYFGILFNYSKCGRYTRPHDLFPYFLPERGMSQLFLCPDHLWVSVVSETTSASVEWLLQFSFS
jgi:hypothetical protein